MIKTKSKIDQKIEALEQQLNNVQGRETEQYARIVGYYRSVKNWNKGKKVEYKQRVHFDNTNNFNPDVNGTMNARAVADVQPVKVTSSDKAIASYLFFYRTTCPNCPPVKAVVGSLEIPGESINADTSNGFTKAAQFEIFTAPTVLFLDRDGVEVLRTSNAGDIKQLLAEKKII